MTIGRHVADDGFDGRAVPQFAFDDVEDATVLAEHEDTAGGVVAAVSLIGIGALAGVQSAV